MRRWTCPTCDGGVLAPDRPRRDDVRRYCLACSAKSGRLIERTCPALERERAARDERNRAKASAQRARESAARRAERERAARQRANAAARAERAERDRRSYRGYDIIAEAQRIWPLMADYHRGRPMPMITLRRRSRGYTTGRANDLHLALTMGGSLDHVLWVLLHELAHAAAPAPRDWHNERWASCYVEAARARWGAEHFQGVRAAKGYAVDRYVAPAVRRATIAAGLVEDPAEKSAAG